MNEQSSEKQIYKNCLYLRQESCDLHSNSALKRITYIKEYLEKQREVRNKMKRNMSLHVGSRWYRAPEIALIEKQYDFASDMWSFGCIIHELIQYFKF
jgi:serine/threonine protein kinase